MNYEELVNPLVKTGLDMGLERIKELLNKLDNPQDSLKVIHVAGTNGKGSTSAMLSSVLMLSGYKTGFFSTPYIEKVNEEFKINNKNISDEKLESLILKIKPKVEEMQEKVTEFELKTAIACEYFKQENCDIVILEAGLGGEKDATNIIKSPILSVITKIGIDHTTYLGDTIEEITKAKAGIIKENCPCVVMRQDVKITNIIKEICAEKNSSFVISEPELAKLNYINLDETCFDYKEITKLKTPLIGPHQVNNATLVIKIIEVLNILGYKSTETELRTGLQATKWFGRFEILSKEPEFIIDGAHNLDGVQALISTLRKVVPDLKYTFILGVMSDKDYVAMIKKLIPFASRFITVTPCDMPRALKSTELANEIQSHFKGEVTPCESIKDAVELAYKVTKTPICCVGSLYMLHQVKSNVKLLK